MSAIEDILKQLLVPDNSSIVQASDALRKALKDPDTILAICAVLNTSEHMQLRQYAAIVLRKRLAKKKHWDKLSAATQNTIKQGILTVLVNEKEKLVKTAIAQFVAAIAKHQMPQNGWPELFKFLHDMVSSTDVNNVGLAMFTISVLTDIASAVFAELPEQLYSLLQFTFTSLDDLSTVVGYYLLLTMSHTVSLSQTESRLRVMFSKAIPCVINGLRNLIPKDEDKACECFEFFDSILEEAPPLLVPHFTIFLQFCFEVAKNSTLEGSLRNKAINAIGWCSKLKPKLFVKFKLIKPAIDVLFAVICEFPDDNDHEDDLFDTDDDETAPWVNACSALSMLAVYLPAPKVLDALMQLVSNGLNSEQLCVRKASYLSLAMIAEGAAECIKKKYIASFFTCIRSGITDHSPIIRNVALYALSQFSEHLQPEISEFANEIMPILFEYLQHACNRLAKKTRVPSRLFVALEVYCENLEEKLLPYLPSLVDKLVMMLNPEYPVEIQESAISCLGSAAHAVNTEFAPYFPVVIEKLNLYLSQEHTDETSCLQVQALDTLSVLTRTVGEEKMAPLATNLMNLGLKLLSTNEDPDLKRAVYSLFSSLASVVRTESGVFLPQLVEMLIMSLKSTEGIVAEFPENEESAFPIYDDLSDSMDEEDLGNESEDTDSEIQYGIENAYTAEKEEALVALKELAIHAGSSFLPYLEKSFDETLKLISYPHEDIRKASIEALAQFSVSFSKIGTAQGNEALAKCLPVIISQCEEFILKDEYDEVVVGALDSLKLILQEVKEPVIKLGFRDTIIKLVIAVLSNKTCCQEKEDEEEVEDGEETSERNELLMETAGDILPALGEAMTADDFVTSLQLVMPYILPKLKGTSSITLRSYFIGTLADCMSHAGPFLELHSNVCNDLLSIFLPLSRDPDPEVRNNAIYGIGELVLHSKQQLFPKYEEILQNLSRALSQETRPGTIDNICGALARLIISNHQLVPMAEVFPVLLEKLPLKDDVAEYDSILNCFEHLYRVGHQILVENISPVIRICCAILNESKVNEEIRKKSAVFLNSCKKDFSSAFTSVLSSLPVDIANTIANIINSIE